ADVAAAQPRDVGVQRRLSLRQVELAEELVLLLAELPRQVVVAVDDQGVRVDAQRLGRQLDGAAFLFRLVLAAGRRGAGGQGDAEPDDEERQHERKALHGWVLSAACRLAPPGGGRKKAGGARGAAGPVGLQRDPALRRRRCRPCPWAAPCC